MTIREVPAHTLSVILGSCHLSPGFLYLTVFSTVCIPRVTSIVKKILITDTTKYTFLVEILVMQIRK